VKDKLKGNEKVLRLRSDLAGPGLAEEFQQLGLEVDDVVLYRNQVIDTAELPIFDAVIFASSSAVNAWQQLWGRDCLKDKIAVVIGGHTGETLQKMNPECKIVQAEEATVEAAVESLALDLLNEELVNVYKTH